MKKHILLFLMLYGLIVIKAKAQVQIAPTGDVQPTGNYAAMQYQFVRGATQYPANLTERDNIATFLRVDGLLAYITSTKQTYQLQGGITNDKWVLVGASGGSAGAYTKAQVDSIQAVIVSGIPTNNNQLANGAGYVTSSTAPVTSVNSQTGDVILDADNINYNGESVYGAINDLNTYKEAKSNKGIANGYASLDGSAKIPTSQLPDAILGSVNYQGNYSASSNTPSLPTASGHKGWYYVINSAGTQQGLDFEVGDWIISNGTTWDKVSNNNNVTSVAGKVGAVTLNKSDVGLGNVDNTSDLAKPVSTATQTALDGKANANGSNATGTWGINISGSANSATKWVDQKFDWSATNSDNSWFMTYNNSIGKWQPTNLAGLKNTLSLPSSGGYDLQGVTDRGTSTTNPLITTNKVVIDNNTDYKLFAVNKSGVARWAFGGDNVSETGANAGTDFSIFRYDDAGNYLSNALDISRATGRIRLGGELNVSNSNPFISLSKSGILNWYLGNNVGDVGANNFSIGTDASANYNILNLLANGDVGIGTTSPEYKLDVAGSTAIRGNQLNFYGTNAEIVNRNAPRLDFYGSGSNLSMSILNNGNVGIGITDTQGHKLFINGSTYADTYYSSNWFRSAGSTGWYNQDYEGGIYMYDTEWVRVYNGKKFRAENDIYSATKVYAPTIEATSSLNVTGNATVSGTVNFGTTSTKWNIGAFEGSGYSNLVFKDNTGNEALVLKEAVAEFYDDVNIEGSAYFGNGWTSNSNATMNGHNITNVASPNNATDAATKEYVDNAVSSAGGATTGEWTPTLVNEANCTSVTGLTHRWVRNGDLITVYGSAEVVPAASGTICQFKIYPQLSMDCRDYDLNGFGSTDHAAGSSTAASAVFIKDFNYLGDGDRTGALVEFYPVETGVVNTLNYSFTYRRIFTD
ncbi:hypothetical protein BCY91_14165 [Pelobium manganitolerans]|uniref:Uncharacterized protein n=1 Tax=Pelobium manganitolerans TaxID=1842495 RepID=A0A419SAD2_9SPHI|nr:hypothetical protein [Pelobium manganitolerans]RKD19018.1 hypothetical protein BCY91_14165 [Pelobium manganitolerans]